ncbi:MAG: hypothetical protein JW882_14035 [Deltaproteobacteria bacterium]|nr:hypothetical protein [Deltaproteobacteria bacterium]
MLRLRINIFLSGSLGDLAYCVKVKERHMDASKKDYQALRKSVHMVFNNAWAVRRAGRLEKVMFLPQGLQGDLRRIHLPGFFTSYATGEMGIRFL